MSGLRVALLYNSKHSALLAPGSPPDALAEYDSIETVSAIERALQEGGNEVIPLLEADLTLLDTLRETRPDICFNIAEGLWGDSREAHVPALLEMLRIPYTGSRVLAQAISLDKAATKHIWRDAGLPTAPFQVFHEENDPLDGRMSFPLFVKPLREGSGMGINENSVVYDEDSLRKQVRWVVSTYHQPALVEAYLPGREFTVGILGNIRRHGDESRTERIYDEHGFHLFPVLEIDATVGVGAGLYSSSAKSYYPGEEGAPRYLCPADIDPDLEAELKRLTVAAFEAIGALDVARVDFRLGADEKAYLMEINTLPGLNPILSDLCIMARADGMPYVTLINEILNLAAAHYGLKTRHALISASQRYQVSFSGGPFTRKGRGWDEAGCL